MVHVGEQRCNKAHFALANMRMQRSGQSTDKHRTTDANGVHHAGIPGNALLELFNKLIAPFVGNVHRSLECSSASRTANKMLTLPL